ncbi:MAG: hypothetical protein ACKVJG_28180 [Candidatus Latescibacterota bacterium]|jgi:hypothetical protein|tara:strand:+ start:45 stop:656 length:612 start_codon:yes stop_codon:yes gene_type:complete
MKFSRAHFALLSTSLWLLVACGGTNSEAPVPPASLETNSLELHQIKDVDAIAVEAFNGPGGAAFEVQQRSSKIGQYPCSSCHTQALDIAPPAEVDRRWTHQNIRSLHPVQWRCATCSNCDDLNTLVLEDGSTVGLDHAYQLCARCHFGQAQDWAGGAHGKRLGGWSGRRIVMNCTDCHDPHAPAFAPRMPLLGPQVPRTGKAH